MTGETFSMRCWFGAMSRLDYEHSVLEADASLIREQCMLQSILSAMSIITAQSVLSRAVFIPGINRRTGYTVAHHKTKENQKIKSADQQDQAWLIRYSFDRLDALNGYASGMPSLHILPTLLAANDG